MMHPHPLYGGDMYNPVVTTLERVLLEVGYTTLRFNFRGASTGYAGVAGAVVDAASALEVFASRGFDEFGYVGYSFGGSTALRLASETSPLFLITLSASSGLVTEEQFELSRLAEVKCPAMMFHGRSDQMVPSEDLVTLSSRLGADIVEVLFLDGEGHFYQRTLTEVAKKVREFLERLS
jgi:alpha/beta superfamily hydrolase